MITTLKITHLRNLNNVSIHPHQCNVIIGDNGSGKTSLLESIFLLSRGKSFRTHQPKRYIQHNKAASTVFAKFTDETTLAIQKETDATTLLKHNGDIVRTQSQITLLMPTLLIDPSSMDILEQGSASRRQLLDWMAFHVEPDFYVQWLAYQRILKQRNSLLKQIKSVSSSHIEQLRAWDNGLARHASLIHHYRESVFNAWVIGFNKYLEQLLPKYSKKIRVSYHAGYELTVPLEDTLAKRLMQDIHQGYTRVGCHRADIQVHWLDNAFDKNVKDLATNVLSRGEKKLLITALKISQLALLQNKNIVYHKKLNTVNSIPLENIETSLPIILLDDITAELDNHAIKILLQSLSSIPCQVFITSLTADVLPLVDHYWQTPKLFHVKHGVLVDK